MYDALGVFLAFYERGSAKRSNDFLMFEPQKSENTRGVGFVFRQKYEY